jgi:S1-C subfamily serine protease
MLKALIILILVPWLYVEGAFAQVYFRLESPSEVVRKKFDAMILIEITPSNGGSDIRGTGFFVGKDGHFITNQHVMAPFLEDSKSTIALTSLTDGEHLGGLEIISCSDKRSIDLCLMKINKKRQGTEYFPLKSATVSKGEYVYSIGHCPNSFTPKEHMVEKIWEDIYTYVNQVKNYKTILVKKRNFKVSSLELKRPPTPSCQKTSTTCPVILSPKAPCPGDSGGPIFNGRGEIVGVVAELIDIPNTGEILENMIAGHEVEQFIKDSMRAKPKEIGIDRIKRPETIESLLKD